MRRWPPDYGRTAINKANSPPIGRGREEMPPALPGFGVAALNPEPGFMYQGGGLERVPGCLGGHLVRCKLAQFVIDEWQEFLGRRGVALRH